MKAMTIQDTEMPVVGPTHEEISLRAHDIYLERAEADGSGAEGTALDDWLQAERELLDERLQHTPFRAGRRHDVSPDFASK